MENNQIQNEQNSQQQNIQQPYNPNGVYIPPQMQRNNMQGGNNSKSQEKFGAFLTTILMFVFGAVCLAGGYLFFFQLNAATDVKVAATIVFIFTYGWITLLPAIVLSIIGIVFGAQGKNSTRTGYKVVSVIFMILNIILLFASVVTLFLLGSIK